MSSIILGVMQIRKQNETLRQSAVIWVTLSADDPPPCTAVTSLLSRLILHTSSSLLLLYEQCATADEKFSNNHIPHGLLPPPTTKKFLVKLTSPTSSAQHASTATFWPSDSYHPNAFTSTKMFLQIPPTMNNNCNFLFPLSAYLSAVVFCQLIH